MKAKYREGEVVKSIGDLADGVIVDHQSFYLNGKIQNWAWLQNMNLRTLNMYIVKGGVRYASVKEPRKGK